MLRYIDYLQNNKGKVLPSNAKDNVSMLLKLYARVMSLVKADKFIETYKKGKRWAARRELEQTA